MHYYSYLTNTKAPDWRGGLTSVHGKVEPRDVEAIVHALVLDESKMSENLVKMLIEERGDKIVSPNLSRPVKQEEYATLPPEIMDELQRLGYSSKRVPAAPGAVKNPFGDNF